MALQLPLIKYRRAVKIKSQIASLPKVIPEKEYSKHLKHLKLQK